jgi:hypothetical protein
MLGLHLYIASALLISGDVNYCQTLDRLSFNDYPVAPHVPQALYDILGYKSWVLSESCSVQGGRI